MESLSRRCPGAVRFQLGVSANGDGQGTIDELLLGVDLALGGQSGTCSKMDANNDGRITVQELVKAVDVALHGCGE